MPGADALRGLAEPDPRRRCPRGGTCQSVSSRARPPGSPPTPRSLPPYSGNRGGGGGGSAGEWEGGKLVIMYYFLLRSSLLNSLWLELPIQKVFPISHV